MCRPQGPLYFLSRLVAKQLVNDGPTRTRAAAALETGDWDRFGKLMNESHRSLAEDYQVSCPELDAMTQIHWELGLDHGVFGCRMTGGGFGGCTVALVQAETAKSVGNQVEQAYQRATGIEPEIFIVTPSDGTRGILIDGSQKS